MEIIFFFALMTANAAILYRSHQRCPLSFSKPIGREQMSWISKRFLGYSLLLTACFMLIALLIALQKG